MKALVVDHNKTTGEIRGLICSSCNQGLAYFSESLDAIEAAIQYLKNPPLKWGKVPKKSR